ncbi:MAG: LamG domain-containing protein [Victivallaceae bacterium]
MKKNICVLSFLVLAFNLFAVTRYVETYGANGGDANNDTAAIQSALSALASGDTLAFGNPGANQIYLVNAQLNLTKTNVNINFLNGAKIKVTGIGGANVPLFFLNSSANGATFNNAWIDGDNKCKLGIYLYICNDVTLNSCTIENINGNWDSQISAAAGVRVRTCANFTMNGGYIKNIVNAGTDSAQEAAGILFTNIDNTTKCYNAVVDGVEFRAIKAVNDADGVKFLTGGIDVGSYVRNCNFYECYKRAVKVQTDNVKISGIYAENTSMDTEINGSYLVDFQQSYNSSLTDSELHVAGRNLAGVCVSGQELLIENVDIYLTRKTNQPGTFIYQVWGIRKQGDAVDFMHNVTMRNINFYGDFYAGIWLKYYSNGLSNSNIVIDNVFSRKGLIVDSGLTSYTTLSNSTFGSYSGVSGSNCLTASSKPVAHYKLDEASGTITDSSGNANNSSAQSITYGSTGKIAGAVSFNGTSDYIQIPSSTSLGNLNHHITIAAWINPFAIADKCIVNKRYGTGANGFELRTYSSGCLRFSFGDGASYYDYNSDASAYTTGAWQHVAAVYNGKNVKFYVNGALKGIRAATGRIATNTYPLFIGKYQTGAYYFSGSMDDVRVYNRSLTPCEIKEAAYMRAYYKLDSNANDETGYNNGTLSTANPATVAAKVGNGYDFDSAAVNFVKANDHSTIDLGSNLTIAAWIKPESLPATATIVNKKYESSTTGYELRTYGAKLKLLINNVVATTTQNLLTSGVFQHVIVTFDGSNARFYVNSELKETVALSAAVAANTEPLHIGIYRDETNYKFNGIIDDIRIYDCTMGQSSADNAVYEIFSEGWSQP